ncbi:MAG: putative metallohydrolase [Candidatus Bathyarchaeota archaeon BA2]|nr:MAG: putative metallohydrolase [Candidatus Bathyarchaeota archaeon BA2]
MCTKLFHEVEDEVTTLLSDLIRINTTNPPGNETPAAKFLAKTLEEEGLECELLKSSKGRGNIIARIKGDGKKPNLLLLSHLDVVPATPKEWSVDPFSGLVKEGYVWGRGALDCKSLVAIETIVMKLLARKEVKLKGDVIFAATADEEMGGEVGVGWLVETHPEKIRADYVINEGNTLPSIHINGKHIFTVQTAEKGIVWMKIKAHGRPGHGSCPGLADNAVLRMAEVARRLGTHRSKIKVAPTVKHMIKELSKERGTIARLLSSLMTKPFSADLVLDQMAKKEKGIAEYLRASMRTTIAPTMVHGGIKENIIPSGCEGVFDCRILPGQTKETLLNEVKEVLKDIENLEFEIIKASEPSESPFDTALYRQVEETLKEFLPGCSVVPFMMTGGTDSRYLRRLGSVCYGFQPLKTDMPMDELLKMIHGVDERISVENLVFGTSVLCRLVERFMT